MYFFKRGNVWWVSVQVKKTIHRLSTGKRDRVEAEEAAQDLVAPLLLRRRADVVESTARKIADALRGDASEIQGAHLSFRDAWRRFPREKAGGEPKAASTLEEARCAWEAFARAMERRGRMCPADVTPEDAREYLSGLPPRWRQVSYCMLRQAYTAIGIPHPFGAPPRRSPGMVQHREALTEEQVRLLLDTVERCTGSPGRASAEYRGFIRFLLYTGLRLGDAATARVSQVDFHAGTLERTMAKTGRRVCIPLHPAILPLLPRDGEYLFPYLAEIYSHGHGAISHRIRAFFKEAGITGPRQAYCPHCLRTTFAEMCAERGVPISVIQSWLGHTSQEVTRIYARVESLRAKREAMAKLPEF